MWRLFEPFHSVYQVAAVLLLWSTGKAKIGWIVTLEFLS